MTSPSRVLDHDMDGPDAPGRGGPGGAIGIPVRNEERDLARSIRRLHAYLAHFPFRTQITIADNGSADGTWQAALTLAATLPGGRAVRLGQPGRGRALRT